MQTATIPAPDIKQVQNKLIEFLTASGWRDKLKTFLRSTDFENILTTLLELRNENKRFTPPLKDIFNCFAQCPYNELKVVFLGPGPYDGFSHEGSNIADGLLFSHKTLSNGRFIKTENMQIREAAGDLTNNSDLGRWAKQGVLLLNTSLTTEIGKPSSHSAIYRNFIAFTLDMINSCNKGLVFVFIGPEAQAFSELIDDKRHYIYQIDKMNQAMEAKEIFTCIDQIQLEIHQTEITW